MSQASIQQLISEMEEEFGELVQEDQIINEQQLERLEEVRL